ncbi:hypothetical protein Tco_0430807 [Tanacetum coccineum]
MGQLLNPNGLDMSKAYNRPHMTKEKLMDELGIYLLQFGRAGYGESDPNPEWSLKTEASDIKELAAQLQLHSKLYPRMKSHHIL